MRKYIWIVLATFLLSSCATLTPHPREWTKGEKAAAGFFVAGHLADYYSTERFLDKPGYYETNPVLGEHPSDTKLTAYFSITALGALAVAHFWPETRHWILWTYGGVGFYYYQHNMKLD